MERYKRTRARNINKEDKAVFKVKIARQSIVCGIIVVFVAVISVLQTNTAVKIRERVDDALSYTVDYESVVGDIMEKINDFTKGEQNDTENPDQTHKN